MLTKAQTPEQAFLNSKGGLPLGNLTMGDSTVLTMFDTGCSPYGLIAAETLDRMRASAGSRLDAIKYFPMPKVISGVGKDAVAIVGTQRLPLHAPDGRPVTITAGVMTNGNTGVADLLCGNWHMRQDWDYTMNSTSFIIKTPEDGLEQPIVIPLEWRLVRKGEKSPDAAHCAFMAGGAHPSISC